MRSRDDHEWIVITPLAVRLHILDTAKKLPASLGSALACAFISSLPSTKTSHCNLL